MTSSDPTPGDADTVRLGIPALAEYAHLARLTASSIAARSDLPYDDVEDMRIAVGELCGVLVDDTPGSRIDLHCTVDDGALVVTATRHPAGEPVRLDDLSRQILEAVTDELQIHDQGAGLTIRKRHRD